MPSAIGAIDPISYGFLDTGLSPKIKHGYHALAIDEKRAQFPPTLWEGQPAADQTLEQVWFTGAHSDIGGGEPDDIPGATELSDITLSWMMERAGALGLQFDPEVQKLYTGCSQPRSLECNLSTSIRAIASSESRSYLAAKVIRQKSNLKFVVRLLNLLECEASYGLNSAAVETLGSEVSRFEDNGKSRPGEGDSDRNARLDVGSHG